MPEPHDCPVTGCVRRKRPSDLLCRIHWYVLDDKHKRAWRSALAALKASKSASSEQALLDARNHAIESLKPRRNPHARDHQA